ncbi:hypothetical protein TNCV_3910651 [Trichonephila clavipes]|nr:hypothetical protein TNCV_3910651 [Trichonephila clavipes]
MHVISAGDQNPAVGVVWKLGERIPAQSDTMASAVLADPTRALHGTNWGSRPAMKESENDVGSRKQLFLYADEHYLAGKLPLGDRPFRKGPTWGRRISST